jgi:hypothetical protein
MVSFSAAGLATRRARRARTGPVAITVYVERRADVIDDAKNGIQERKVMVAVTRDLAKRDKELFFKTDACHLQERSHYGSATHR